MGSKQNENVHGEGNYKAARAAAPRSPREAREMKAAEQAALLRAKIQPPPAKGRKIADYD